MFVGDSPGVLRVRWRFAWTPPEFVGDSPGLRQCSLAIRLESSVCPAFSLKKSGFISPSENLAPKEKKREASSATSVVVGRKVTGKQKMGGLKCLQCGCSAKSYPPKRKNWNTRVLLVWLLGEKLPPTDKKGNLKCLECVRRVKSYPL